MTDPYRAYNFKLDIQGVNEGHFTECSGLGIKIENLLYREAGDPPRVRCLPGKVTHGEVTLRYGLTTSSEMWQWFESGVSGKVDRKDISVLMLDETGDEVIRWNLFRAWISEWQGVPLDAMGHAAAVESMTIVFERLERA